MKRLGNHGFSILESVAAIVIITFMLLTTVTIIISARNQSLAAKEEIKAIEIGTRIRDNIFNQIEYDDIQSWVVSGNQMITNGNCVSTNSPFSCDLTEVEIDGEVYSNLITITFYQQSVSDLEFRTIYFDIVINYYSIRTIELSGVIYDE